MHVINKIIKGIPVFHRLFVIRIFSFEYKSNELQKHYSKWVSAYRRSPFRKPFIRQRYLHFGAEIEKAIARIKAELQKSGEIK